MRNEEQRGQESYMMRSFITGIHCLIRKLRWA